MRISILLSILLIATSCYKEVPKQELPSSDDRIKPTLKSCSYNLKYTYQFRIDPAQDFVDENVIVQLEVSDSSCDHMPNGELSTVTVDYITKIGNVMTSANFNEIAKHTELIDINLDKLLITPLTLNFCLDGNRVVEEINHQVINPYRKTITLYSRNEIKSGQCSEYSAPPEYYSQTPITGRYISSCNNGKIHSKSFFANAAMDSTFYFENSDCSGDPIFSIDKNGPFLANSNGPIYEIDISYQKYFIKVFDKTLIGTFSSNKICGVNNWNGAIDVSVWGKTCDLSALGFAEIITFPSSKQMEYNITQVDNLGAYFGDNTTGSGTSLADRPTHFLTSKYDRAETIYAPTWVNSN